MSSLHEEEVESRWEAAPAAATVIVLQLALAMVSEHQGWMLWGLPWWIWLAAIVPELVLFGALALSRPHHALVQSGHRRKVALALFVIISVENAIALAALIGSLVTGHEKSGTQLLFKAVTIWSTNVLIFGLWYWAIDRGGPVRRVQPDPPPRDFQFPQDENPQLAEPNWRTHVIDYVYVSFTNSIAFSPTDAMPLTRRAKLLMLLESSASAMTILLCAARAVNILSS
ncbi:MAG TPA: hypothetical protein VMT59_13610 [Gaiellaceae bacterium]|nr:hypothetical protein [Gaiellaceae bacterium]